MPDIYWALFLASTVLNTSHVPSYLIVTMMPLSGYSDQLPHMEKARRALTLACRGLPAQCSKQSDPLFESALERCDSTGGCHQLFWPESKESTPIFPPWLSLLIPNPQHLPSYSSRSPTCGQGHASQDRQISAATVCKFQGCGRVPCQHLQASWVFTGLAPQE